MRSKFNLYTRVPQTNCQEALRQTAEPNFHLSSIELIDAAENGWSCEPQLRIANRMVESLWLFGLTQECAGDGATRWVAGLDKRIT